MSLNISIDLDGTIRDENGSLVPGVREALIELHRQGMTLQLWSTCGAQYARDTAVEFVLTDLFDSYATKPDLAIDDQPGSVHPCGVAVLPFSMATKAIASTLGPAVEKSFNPSHDLVDLVQEILADEPAIRAGYGPLINLDYPFLPVPFFGPLESAQVLTVALNPSVGEFFDWRRTGEDNWRNQPVGGVDAVQFSGRLNRYFSDVQPPPHPWFGEYQAMVGMLQRGYQINAAHIDLSPWPVNSPTYLDGVKDPILRRRLLNSFNSLMESDRNRWLVRLAGLAEQTVRLCIVIDAFEDRRQKTCSMLTASVDRVEGFSSMQKAATWVWKNRTTLIGLLGPGQVG